MIYKYYNYFKAIDIPRILRPLRWPAVAGLASLPGTGLRWNFWRVGECRVERGELGARCELGLRFGVRRDPVVVAFNWTWAISVQFVSLANMYSNGKRGQHPLHPPVCHVLFFSFSVSLAKKRTWAELILNAALHAAKWLCPEQRERT